MAAAHLAIQAGGQETVQHAAEKRARREAQGLEIATRQNPEQLASFIQAEVHKWGQVVKTSGARVD